jgi:pimeloyl-ACP methyl ester carboxylesterase
MSASFRSFDGAELAVTRLGPAEGRPLILVHGFISSAKLNWIEFGTAAYLTEAGFRLIMPDLRGHGASAAAHDATAYPVDVLARDVAALVAHEQVSDFDLAGYSLGARTSIRACVSGLRPRRLVLGGMGLSGIVDAMARQRWFINAIETRAEAKPGSAEIRVARFLKSTGTDPVAAALVLRSMVDTPVADLAALNMSTLVVCGEKDQDNGSAQALAEALPNARYAEIPGDHMSAITTPTFGTTIRDFLVS